jgi:peptidyl-tRNA hydrolase, PTH2 family
MVYQQAETTSEEKTMSELKPTNRKRIVVHLNKNLKMSPNKAAAQAVHAALNLLGVHPGEDVPVIVLSGSKATVEAQDSVIADHGVTEVKPGAITAGASWDFPVETLELEVWMRYVEANKVREQADAAFVKAREEYFDSLNGIYNDKEKVQPFGHKE